MKLSQDQIEIQKDKVISPDKKDNKIRQRETDYKNNILTSR